MPTLDALLRRIVLPVAQIAAGFLAFPAAAMARDAGPMPAPAVAESASDRPDLLVGMRGLGETWQDPIVTRHYGSGRFAGTAFVNAPLNGWLGLEVEAGYSKTLSEGQRIASSELELIPVSVDLVIRRDIGSVEFFGGAGYGMTIFTETTGVESVSGVKPGVDLRVGTRIHTGLVRERLRPWGSSSIKDIDFELLLGRRQHHGFGMGTGFDFSAWRFGAGLTARL